MTLGLYPSEPPSPSPLSRSAGLPWAAENYRMGPDLSVCDMRKELSEAMNLLDVRVHWSCGDR